MLTNNNIDPDKDVNISYVGGASEVPSLILSGKAKIAVVPEPMLSTVLSKKSDLKVICNINDEWKKILGSDDGYPQSTLIVKDDLLENSEEFINEFNKLISKDIDFVNTNREEAGKMCEELGISVAAPILVKALDNANLKYKNISETKDAYNNYYKKLNEYEPKLIGGKVPDEKIFAK